MRECDHIVHDPAEIREAFWPVRHIVCHLDMVVGVAAAAADLDYPGRIIVSGSPGFTSRTGEIMVMAPGGSWGGQMEGTVIVEILAGEVI